MADDPKRLGFCAVHAAQLSQYFGMRKWKKFLMGHEQTARYAQPALRTHYSYGVFRGLAFSKSLNVPPHILVDRADVCGEIARRGGANAYTPINPRVSAVKDPMPRTPCRRGLLGREREALRCNSPVGLKQCAKAG